MLYLKYQRISKEYALFQICPNNKIQNIAYWNIMNPKYAISKI